MEVREPSAKYLARPGYKQTDLGVIPRDWNVVPMGQVSECLIGLTYSPFDVRDFGTLVLRSSNIQNGKLAFDDNVFVDMDVPTRAITRKNDILICVRNGSRQLIGKCALIDDKTAGSAFGAFMSVLRSDSAKFLFFQFQSSIQKRQIDEVMGATINQITNKDMAAFKVIWPSTKAEQEAIAEALSDVDALIESLDQLLAKKRQLKQGAMQQLLTGRKRLPGFSGEWEVKRLGDVCRITTGKKDVNEGNPEGQFPFFTCSRSHTFSDSYSFDAEAILIAGNGEVGNLHYFKGKFEAYQRTYVLSQFSAHVGYLWQQLSAYLADSLGLGKIGSSIPYIKKENLAGFEFKSPQDEAEQTAIAAILSDMDAEIAALEAKLAKARDLKQGMMQELLTGRIRLV